MVCLTIINNLLDQTEQLVVEKRIQLFNDFDINAKLLRISNEEDNKEVTTQANRILVHLKSFKK